MLTNADAVQKFSHVRRVWRSTWSLVDTTWRCTWKLTLNEGLTTADIEEIVTNISPKPQSWRYISFSTAERSPKCNSTQEKSPCEQCVKIVYTRNNIKHTWIFLLCHEMDQCAPSRVFPIETGTTIDTSWGQLMVSPHGGDDMLAEVWSWSEHISTHFTYEISFVNHLYLLIGELHFYDNLIIFLLQVFKCVLKTLWL